MQGFGRRISRLSNWDVRERNVNGVSRWLRSFLPAGVSVDARERVRASLGALVGLALTGWVSYLVLPGSLPLLIAPMGASAVLLFAVPSSPLAQPWSIIGGNLVSAVIGVTCARWIPQMGIPSPIMTTALTAAVAASAAIGAMFALRCLHPPSGAVALTAVLGGPAIHGLGYGFVWMPVGVNSLLLLLTALLFNNLTRRTYPHPPQVDHSNVHRTGDPTPRDRLGFTPEDLERALRDYNQVLDVGRDDLESLFLQIERHAFRRRFGEIACGDIMSRHVVTVEPYTSLPDAWALLRRHKVKALPVIDPTRRVVGIITVADFLKHAEFLRHAGPAEPLRRLVRQAAPGDEDQPDVVSQIMTRSVLTVSEDVHIVELVPLLSDRGLHHIPVVDASGKLTGMVTQSDLIAALYRQRLEEGVQPSSATAGAVE